MPRKPKSRSVELADADALMRDIEQTDDAAEIRALVEFLRTHQRARVWIQSLIPDHHLEAFVCAVRDGDTSHLASLGVGAGVTREIRQHDSRAEEIAAYGGRTEREVLLLIQRVGRRQPRISLRDFLILRLWRQIVHRNGSTAVPLPLERATLALWRSAIAENGSRGLERLGAALRLLDRCREGKRSADQEWRLDVLRYILRNPKPLYTIAELRRAIPPEYAPRERKDVLNFCRKHEIAAGRPRQSLDKIGVKESARSL